MIIIILHTDRYICKDVDSVQHSKHYPNLDDVAACCIQTKNSTMGYWQARKPYDQENPTDAPLKKKQKATSRKPLTQFKGSEFLLTKNKHRDTEPFYEANKRKKEGQTDLAAFVLSRSRKSFNDLVGNTWKMDNAKTSIEREKNDQNGDTNEVSVWELCWWLWYGVVWEC